MTHIRFKIIFSFPRPDKARDNKLIVIHNKYFINISQAQPDIRLLSNPIGFAHVKKQKLTK